MVFPFSKVAHTEIVFPICRSNTNAAKMARAGHADEECPKSFQEMDSGEDGYAGEVCVQASPRYHPPV